VGTLRSADCLEGEQDEPGSSSVPRAAAADDRWLGGRVPLAHGTHDWESVRRRLVGAAQTARHVVPVHRLVRYQ
jgi:hypothetical protein